MDSPRITEIDFAELSDGSLVEMIEDPADAGKTLLAVYRDHVVRYTDKVEDGGRILMPLSRANRDLRHVSLAQGAEAYGQLLELEGNVSAVLQACLDLTIEWRILLTAYIISTFFAEKLPVAPYLALVGPPGSGKTTAMRVLSLLCYRSLLTADITSAAFYDISDRIRPTILLDETLTAGNQREMMHLLKASSTPGFVSLRKDSAHLAYGPKVFSWLELPDDAALNSRCVICPMCRTTRTDLRSPNDPRVLKLASRVRMQLQQFRFEHYKRVSVPKPPPDEPLSGRPLDLYRALALPFDQDPKMCNLLAYMIAHQDNFQARPLSAGQASVIRVLYDQMHKDPAAPGFRVGGLTLAVNSDLKSRGESAGLKERKVGDILTSLSFTNRSRQNKGWVLWLERSDRARIHATARDYGVEGIAADSIENCTICGGSSSPAVESTSENGTEEKTGSENATSERCEHRARRYRSGKRLRASAKSRLYPPKIKGPKH